MTGTRRGEACPAVAGGWHAVRTRPQHELAVARRLEAEGVPVFWPSYRERVRWSDREQAVLRSLFPGYLFAFYSGDLVYVSGILQILGEPVESSQIESIRRAIEANANVSPCAYGAGAAVRIRQGPFAGCEGTIERIKGGGRRLILRVDLLRRAVAVELDSTAVTR